MDPALLSGMAGNIGASDGDQQLCAHETLRRNKVEGSTQGEWAEFRVITRRL